MSFRFPSFLLILSLALVASAKDKIKEKGGLPDYILDARTVQVIVSPEASDSLEDPPPERQSRTPCRRGEDSHSSWRGVVT